MCRVATNRASQVVPKWLRRSLKKALVASGYELKPIPVLYSIPDAEFYRRFVSDQPFFSPWLGYGECQSFFKAVGSNTLVSADRLYLLYSFANYALHLAGEFWECGVYRGGTARMFAEILRAKATQPFALRLFDTFEGMPETDSAKDLHEKGDFADTNLASVRRFVGQSDFIDCRPGFMPATFKGLESARIAFAHVDVDIYDSVYACSEFIYPRLVPGGVMIFDDYGQPTCPGARRAVDQFFATKQESPTVLPSAQALVIKLPSPLP